MNPIATKSLPDDRTFSVVIYDILFEPTDCIVNPANGGLSHGGGVAAAIAEAAGSAFDDECSKIVQTRGRIPVGEAVVTSAGRLPFKGVIHVVGPRRGSGDEEKKLTKALQSAFDRATERGWKSLSFPAVSSGMFSVPIDICARAYVRSVVDYFEKHPNSSLRIVRLCLYRGPLVEAVIEEMEKTGIVVAPPLTTKREYIEESDIPVFEIDEQDDFIR